VTDEAAPATGRKPRLESRANVGNAATAAPLTAGYEYPSNRDSDMTSVGLKAVQTRRTTPAFHHRPLAATSPHPS
jgi:hypothetical protein